MGTVHVSAENFTVLTSSYASSQFKGMMLGAEYVCGSFGQGRTAYTSFGAWSKSI